MEIKRLVISTYYNGIKNLTPNFFKNFNFEEEVLKKEYPRGFLLGVKLLQNEDGSTSAMLEDENLDEIMSCPVILIGDHFNVVEIIDRLADDITGLIYHSETCDEQVGKFTYKQRSIHIDVDGESIYAYCFRKLGKGTSHYQEVIESIIDIFSRRL